MRTRRNYYSRNRLLGHEPTMSTEGAFDTETEEASTWMLVDVPTRITLRICSNGDACSIFSISLAMKYFY